MVPGNQYFLFLKSRRVPHPPVKVAAPFGLDSISFVDKYPGAKIYHLTTDTAGIMPWSADIEIRLGQMLHAKQKH
jgi:hypothetical protein